MVSPTFGGLAFAAFGALASGSARGAASAFVVGSSAAGSGASFLEAFDFDGARFFGAGAGAAGAGLFLSSTMVAVCEAWL
jgi:hypothetical protein